MVYLHKNSSVDEASKADLITEHSAGGSLILNVAGESCLLVMNCRGENIELPKGHVESGETPEQAALREFHEETGIEIELNVKQRLGNVQYCFKNQARFVNKYVDYFLFSANKVDAMAIKTIVTCQHQLYWFPLRLIRFGTWVSDDLKSMLVNELI